MVNLTRIYTRTGDDGTTGYGGRGRITKNDVRLIAYAECDEANSAIGVAVAVGGLDDDVLGVLNRLQNDLFDVGADLCTPVEPDPEYPPLRVTQEQIEAVEREIDHFNADLDKLRSFVLPGGSLQAAQLHVARTVVRRAERATWVALAEHSESMNDLTAKYLNRASDLLFVLGAVRQPRARRRAVGPRREPLTLGVGRVLGSVGSVVRVRAADDEAAGGRRCRQSGPPLRSGPDVSPKLGPQPGPLRSGGPLDTDFNGTDAQLTASEPFGYPMLRFCIQRRPTDQRDARRPGTSGPRRL